MPEAGTALAELEPHEIERLAREATELLHQGDYPMAEARLRQVLAYRPEEPGIFHLLGIALDRQGRTGDAAAAALRVTQLVPDRADAYVTAASLLRKAKEPARAEALLRDGLAVCGEIAALHDSLGQALEDQGQSDAALGEAEHAAELDPANPHLQARLGHLLLLPARRYADAEAALRRAIALRPGLVGCHDALGLALEWQERWVDAAAAVEAAIALEPANPDRYLRAGQLLMRDHAFDDAARVLRQGIERLPQRAALHDMLSLALQRGGRTADAIAALREAIKLDGGNVGWHLRLGHLLVRADDLDGAEIAFRRAGELDPGSVEARQRLAAVAAAREASGQPAGGYRPGSRPLYLVLAVAQVGLGHLFESILHSAYYAHRTGRTLAVDARRFAYAKADRHAAFLTHFGFDFPPDLEVITDLAEIDRLTAGPDTHYLDLQEAMDVLKPLPNAVVFVPGNTPGAPFSLEVKQHDGRFRIVLKGRLQAEWERAMSLPQWSGPVIGLHYRASVGEMSDRSIQEFVPDYDARLRKIQDQYVETALAAAKAAGYVNPAFLATSDDAGFVAYLKERLPNAFSLATRLLEREFLAHLYSQDHDIGILIDAVNDMWCLSACDQLVHGRSAFTDAAILNSTKLGKGDVHYIHVPTLGEMLREVEPGTAVVWARAAVRKADARRTSQVYWHEWLAEALDRAGMEEAAGQARRRARWHWEATVSDVADTPARLARAGWLARGEYGPVIAEQRRMVAALPDNPYVLSGFDWSLSSLLVRSGGMAEALAAARRAIELDGADGYLHRHLGWLLMEAGDLAGAEAALRRAIACDPEVPLFYNELVACLARRGGGAAGAGGL